MDRETQKRILRENRAGFEWLAQREIEEARAMSVADRLDAFYRIVEFVRELSSLPPDRRDDDVATERWTRIRARYEAQHR